MYTCVSSAYECPTSPALEQLSGVQQKQQRAEDRALWNAEEQLDDCRQLPVVADEGRSGKNSVGSIRWSILETSPH